MRNNPLSSTDPDGHADGIWSRVVGYYTGVGKGWVNSHLKNDTLLGKAMKSLGVQEQVATNRNENFGMQDSDTVVGITAMAIPGPKAAKLPNEANVVRGGVAVSEKAVAIHPTAGVTGVSVESAPGKSVTQLAKESPTVSGYGQVRCCTVGEVRQAGGNVVVTPGKSPNHATLTGLSPSEINKVPKPPIPNPAKKVNE